MKIFKQSGPAAQIVVFFAVLVVVCLGALGLLAAVLYFKGIPQPFMTVQTATATASPLPTQTETPSPTVFFTLTPLPAQWTKTPTPLPGQASDTPTPTLAQLTVASTAEVTPLSATPSPDLPDTPTPESDFYLRQTQLKFISFQSSYSSFKDLNQQLESNSALIRDEKWKTVMLVSLASLEQTAIRLAASSLPNPNYAVYASYLDQLSTETGLMAVAYRKGLDKEDPVSRQIVIIHLQKMEELLLKAEQEYKAVKSRLATPALPLEPSLTPTP